VRSLFLFHGAYGSPDENWFPWLRRSLGDEWNVIIPRFPTPEGQDLDRWLETLEPHRGSIDDKSVFVGHSIGAAFALRVLERWDAEVAATILVAGFVSQLSDPRFDPLNASFLEPGWDWKKIRGASKRFIAFASEDDPYVPVEKSKELQRQLPIEMQMIEGAGHFNMAAGYAEFPQLLERIQTL
jgi:uncharacterized protein